MTFFHLTQAFGITVEGKHAQRYLQARLTQDLRPLSIGTTCMAAALSPQGKTEAIFCVERVSELRYDLFSLHGDTSSICAALLRYKVADQFTTATIAPEDSVITLNTGAEPPPAGARTVRMPHPHAPAYLCILPKASLSSLPRGDDKAFFTYRFTAHLPLFESEILSTEIFPETALRSYLSHQKGCYTGQEVVEKIDAYGQAPYTLMRCSVTSSREVTPYSTILIKEKKWGKILSCVNVAPHQHYAFCLIKTDYCNDIEKETASSEQQFTTITAVHNESP